MKYRKQDQDGDYVFGHSSNDFLEGPEAVAQAVKTNLKLLMNEWWEDRDKGLPLFQNIMGQFGSPQNVQAADLLVQSTISNTPGVTRIRDFKSTYDESRKYSLSCQVDTQFGSFPMEVTFP